MVNGRPAKPALKVGPEDVITGGDLNASQAAPDVQTGSEPQIVFEDEVLIVLNKPVGWTVHSAYPGQRGPFVTDWLTERDPVHFGMTESNRPGIVHRLDQLTEGVMVVAKTPEVLELLKDQFRNRTVDKGYYAAVRGNILSEEIVINQPMMRNPKTRHKMVVHPEGKPALSTVRVVKRLSSMTVVEVVPKTGRTHQIRVHLDFIGHPVIGDPLYRKGPGPRDGQRLQAYRLGFNHPISGEPMRFELPMSERILK